MKGDRVHAVVDTGGGVQTFDIVATRAGRRLEVTTARGIVEVSEVTRGGSVVRTGRFMANRLIALVEYPALEGGAPGVEVTTRRRIGPRVNATVRHDARARAVGPGRRRAHRPGADDVGAEPELVEPEQGAEPAPRAEPLPAAGPEPRAIEGVGMDAVEADLPAEEARETTGTGTASR